MKSFSRSLAGAIASIVLMLGGCAADLEDRRLGFVSMGMTPNQVARLLGAPARSHLDFEPSGYFLIVNHGKVDGMGKQGPSGASENVTPGDLAALGLRADASASDFQAALGTPAKEDAWYYVNEVYCFRVHFENGRVVSKEKFHFPPI